MKKKSRVVGKSRELALQKIIFNMPEDVCFGVMSVKTRLEALGFGPDEISENWVAMRLDTLVKEGKLFKKSDSYCIKPN